MGSREDSQIAAIHVLVFQFGGVAGAIRRIVHGWPGRFSRVQISIALQRRCPLLVANQHQVADCLDLMEKQRLIEVVIHKRTKIYERKKHQFSNHRPGLGALDHGGQIRRGGMLAERTSVSSELDGARWSLDKQGQRKTERVDAIQQPVLPWLEENFA